MSDCRTVVHRIALVQHRSTVLVQRVELVLNSEALWGFLVGSWLPFGDDWCLVDLASIARAARGRAHLIFNIGAAAHDTSLQIRQLTTSLSMQLIQNSLHAGSFQQDCNYHIGEKSDYIVQGRWETGFPLRHTEAFRILVSQIMFQINLQTVLI